MYEIHLSILQETSYVVKVLAASLYEKFYTPRQSEEASLSHALCLDIRLLGQNLKALRDHNSSAPKTLPDLIDMRPYRAKNLQSENSKIIVKLGQSLKSLNEAYKRKYCLLNTEDRTINSRATAKTQ